MMLPSDLALHAGVSAAVRSALGPAATGVGVTVRDGIVTLTGSVSSAADRLRVSRAAQHVHGVYAVADELAVEHTPAEPVSDERLARDLVDALAVGEHRIGVGVTISVSHGWVMVGGTVQSAAEYSAVERAIECVPGVRGVTSEIRVAESATVDR